MLKSYMVLAYTIFKPQISKICNGFLLYILIHTHTHTQIYNLIEFRLSGFCSQ